MSELVLRPALPVRAVLILQWPGAFAMVLLMMGTGILIRQGPPLSIVGAVSGCIIVWGAWRAQGVRIEIRDTFLTVANPLRTRRIEVDSTTVFALDVVASVFPAVVGVKTLSGDGRATSMVATGFLSQTDQRVLSSRLRALASITGCESRIPDTWESNVLRYSSAGSRWLVAPKYPAPR